MRNRIVQGCCLVVQGNFHQGATMFSLDSAGKQCTCNALVAACILPNIQRNVTRIDLDNILFAGDKMYTEVTQQLGVNGYLSFTELPDELEFDNIRYEVQRSQNVYYGMTVLDGIATVNFASLLENLRLAFEDHTQMLFMLGENALCLFRDVLSRYAMFDSHSRNQNGLLSENGLSVCLYFWSLEDLCSSLHRLSGSLADRSLPYEIQPVTVRQCGQGSVTANVIEQSHDNLLARYFVSQAKEREHISHAANKRQASGIMVDVKNNREKRKRDYQRQYYERKKEKMKTIEENNNGSCHKGKGKTTEKRKCSANVTAGNKRKKSNKEGNAVSTVKSDSMDIVPERMVNDVDISPHAETNGIAENIVHTNDDIQTSQDSMLNDAIQGNQCNNHTGQNVTEGHKIFLEMQAYGPEFVCCCCSQTWFKSSVTALKKIVPKLDAAIMDLCMLPRIGIGANTWLCSTCKTALLERRIPKLAAANGMKFPEKPSALDLYELEERLIAPRLPFMQIRELARGRQFSMSGSVVNVPNPIETTMRLLPRPVSSMDTVAVKLKKRQQYKSAVYSENVRPVSVVNALQWLLQHSPLWQDLQIQFDDDWYNQFQTDDDVDDNIDMGDHDSRKNGNDEDKNTENCLQCSGEEHRKTDEEFRDQSSVEQENFASNNICNHDNGDIDGDDDDDRFSEIDRNELPQVHETFLDSYSDSILNIAPGENQIPLSLFQDADAEYLAFPTIYCGQRMTPAHERLVHVSYADICKWEVRASDRRVAKSVPNLFFKMKKLSIKQVLDKANFAIRRCKTKGKRLTAKDMMDDNVRDSLARADEGYRIFKELRNSPAYLQKRKKDVFAMIRQLGIPSLFMSLSANDLNWIPLLKVLSKFVNNTDLTDEEASELSWAEKTKLVQSDPVTCARYFDYRVQLFMEHVMKSSALGDIHDFFWRIEFQKRGSPHVHMLVWIRGAPVYGVNTDDEIAAFIDKGVSCSALGNASVVDLQRHKHSKTCRKGRKPICRFGFPIPPMEATCILTPLDEEELAEEENHQENLKEIKDKLNEIPANDDVSFPDFLDSMGMSRDTYFKAVRSELSGPKVYLKRRPSESRINPYLVDGGDLWKANHDVQFCLDSFAVASYIVSYINKDDKGMSALMEQACKEAKEGNKTLKEQVRHIGNKFINAVEVSAQEAVYLILQMPLTKASRQVVFINTSPPAERVFILKGKEQLKEMNPNSEDVEMTSVLKTYAQRPPAFNNMCLADFVSKIAVDFPRGMTPEERANFGNDDVPDNSDLEEATVTRIQLDNGIVFRLRKNPRIIRFVRYNIKTDPDNFYREKLMLYIPWRNEDIDLIAGFPSMKESFLAREQEIVSNSREYEPSSDNVDDIESIVQQVIRDDIAPSCQQVEAEDAECGDVDSEAFAFFDPERDGQQLQYDIGIDVGLPPLPAEVTLLPTFVPDDEFRKQVQSLNKSQFEFFSHVLHTVKLNNEKLRVFLSGGAGVGKSVVVRTLYQALMRWYCKTPGMNPENIYILICAPTGKAAHNVNGNTLHHAFKIAPNRGFDYKPLTSDSLNTLRVKYIDLQVLIIDEVSMVGNRLMNTVNLRLQEIMGNKQVFGGVHVILIGDLFQLQPVMDSWVFQNTRSAYGPLSTNIWTDHFTMHELTQIMRQKDDAAFAQLLNRLREGNQTTADIQALKQCIVTNDNSDSLTIPHLFPTNIQVDSYNDMVFNHSSAEKCAIQATDVVLGDYSNSVKKATLQRLPSNTSATGNLSQMLQVGKGLRYDITCNINVQDGLVNGTSCILRHIQYIENSTKPAIMWVKFDQPATGSETRMKYRHFYSSDISNTWTPLFATTVSFQVGRDHKRVSRTQFPLRAATAKTIHKSQGDTLEKVVVHLGTRKQHHTHYVAMSRVTKKSGLAILHLNEHKISVDPLVVEEMARLRNTAKMTLSYTPMYDLPIGLTKIAFQNARSFHKHYTDVRTDHNLIASDILAIAESRLSAVDSDANYHIEGFYMYRNDSETHATTRPHHGLVLYIKGGHAISHITNYSTTTFECMHFQDLVTNSFVCVIYKSPTCSLVLLKHHVSQILQHVREHQSFILIGDMNLDVGSPQYNDFYQWLACHIPGEQLCQQPTTDYNSTLDHVYTNHPTAQVAFFESSWSDHKAVCLYA